MTRLPVQPSVQIAVIPATSEQRPILANLLELYAHDFSEFYDLELGADGRFGYKHLTEYIDSCRQQMIELVDAANRLSKPISF